MKNLTSIIGLVLIVRGCTGWISLWISLRTWLIQVDFSLLPDLAHGDF